MTAQRAVSEQECKLVATCERRMAALRMERVSWWTHWKDLADFLLPRRYQWLIITNKADRGSQLNSKIIDSTGSLAMRVLASGMMSGITSPGRPWFNLNLEGEFKQNRAVNQWLSDARNVMLRIFAESTLYNTLAVLYQDLCTFGTGVAILYEDFEDVVSSRNVCAGEYFLAASQRDGVADTLYREITMTCEQIYSEFGEENCSQGVVDLVKQGGTGLSKEKKVAHAIEPNADYLEGAPGVKGMPYREVYWEFGHSGGALRIRGFHERPFIAPRWDTVGSDPYGRGPGMDALPHIKQLQVMARRLSQAIDKHVNPPMIASIDLKNEPASLLPGGITYVSGVGGNVGFRPAYEVKPDYSGLVNLIQDTRDAIQKTFYTDLFLMISQLDTVRTATEIDARREEKLIQLGPVLERFQNEALDPLVERVFGIALRAGVLPPPPPELQGAPIRCEYVSILAQAQRATQTTGIERMLTLVGNMAGAHPEALDMVDFDAAIKEYNELLGNQPKILADDRIIKQIRAARAQAQQQQIQQQQAMAQVQAAQNLSQTDVGGGQNALQQIMGNANV
ncbi:MAG: portal protein [Serratia fonticola]